MQIKQWLYNAGVAVDNFLTTGSEPGDSIATSLHKFFFSDPPESSDSNDHSYEHIPDLDELDCYDKFVLEALFAYEVEDLEEDIATMRYKQFTEILDSFSARVGKYTLSPYHYHSYMRDFCHRFVKNAAYITHYEAKLELIRDKIDEYKAMVGNTLFMEHCLEGDLMHFDVVFQGGRRLYGKENCLDMIFYYKNKVSPLLYSIALTNILEMLEKYEFAENFGQELYDALQSKLNTELLDNQWRLESAPKKLPLLWIAKAQPKPEKKNEIDITFLQQVMRNVFKLTSYPVKNPFQIFLAYALLAPRISAARELIQDVRGTVRPTSGNNAHRNNKRFTNITPPFQTSVGNASTPAVASWGASNFMGMWVNSSNSFGTGAFLSSVDGSSLGTLQPVNLVINATVATGTPTLGSISGWIQQVSPTNFTMSAINIDSTGAPSAPSSLFTGMSSHRGYLSQHSFSTGGFAGVAEVNDGSGSGIQLKYYTAASGTVCTVIANTNKTGNQLYPTVDVLTTDEVMVAWTQENVAGSGVGIILGQKFGSNCGFVGGVLTLDNSSQFLTLPWVSQLPGGFSTIWHLYNITSGSSATYQQLFYTSGIADSTRLPLENVGNTNGNHPITIGLKEGGSANFWQTCTIIGTFNGGANVLQFTGKSGDLVGSYIFIGNPAYCGDISAAVSQDGKNIILSWTDRPSLAPPNVVLAAGINIGFTVTNFNTINQFTENTQLSFSHPPQVQLPNNNPGTPANVTVTFTYDTTVGNLTVSNVSGLITSYNPFSLNGDLNPINQALNTLTYIPTSGFANDFNITINAVDNYGLAPTETGQISVTGTPVSSASPTVTGNSPATTGGTAPATGTGQTTGGNTASPSTSGSSSGSSGKSFPVGAVAGAAAGGAFCLLGGGALGFFGVRACKKSQRYTDTRRSTNIRKLADCVYESLSLKEFKNFEDGVGAEFLNQISLIANIWKQQGDHESIDVGQKIDSEIKDLSDFLATSIKDRCELTRTVTPSKAYYGFYNTLDLNKLIANRQSIANDVMEQVRRYKSDLLNAHSKVSVGK